MTNIKAWDKTDKGAGEGKYRELYFYLFIGVMLAVLFLRNASIINIPVIFLLALAAIPAIFGTNDEVLALALCCIPMSTGFQFKYALFLCIIAFFFKNGRRIDINSVLFSVLAMMVWELCHVFLGQFEILEYFRGFAELLFIALVVSGMDMKEINYKFILRALSISTVGVCAIMLYIQLMHTGMDFSAVFSRDAGAFRFGQGNTDAENFGLNFNANGLGFVCNLSTAGMLFLIGRSEHNIFDIVLTVLSIVFGLTTLSRTYIVCLAFLILCYVLFASSGSVYKKAANILGAVLLCGVVVFVILKFAPQVFYNIIARFSEEDVTNGRDSLFVFYLQHIFSSVPHFLFGIGMQSFLPKLESLYGLSVIVCHNGIEEVWVAWGIVGVILFAFFVVSLVLCSGKYSGKRRLVSFVPLGLIFLYTSAGQLIRAQFALLAFIFAYIIMCVPDSASGEEEKNCRNKK